MNPFYSLVSLALFFLAYSPSKTDKSQRIIAHQTRFVPVADSVKLEVLDWGGQGDPLVFLTGIGNTAHVFDEFAPKFTDHYHVYALTRRGSGQSSKPKTGYDMMTLAHDILVVLDSLHIHRALLVGHSIAGNEMSTFAPTYPDRVAKLVYLDAAYDRSKLMSLKLPDRPYPTQKDVISFASIKAYSDEVTGASEPAEEIRETIIFSKEGRALGFGTPDFVFRAVFSKLAPPDYRHIRCPALAIYAEYTSVQSAFPFYGRLDSTGRKKAQASFPLMRQWTAEQEALFRSEVVKGRVEVLKDANHYLFLSHPAETEKLIRAFLN